MAKRPWSLMCLNGRGKVKGINSCLRKEIQGMVGDVELAFPQIQVHLALLDQGSSSPSGSFDLLEDPKPEQRKHNTTAYTGQVL